MELGRELVKRKGPPGCDVTCVMPRTAIEASRSGSSGHANRFYVTFLAILAAVKSIGRHPDIRSSRARRPTRFEKEQCYDDGATTTASTASTGR
jgi:hypothetical protein